MKRTIVHGQVVTPAKVLDHAYLEIQEGSIHSIALEKPADDSSIVETNGAYILPGFRDQHIHDWLGQKNSPSQQPEEITGRFRHIMQALVRQGITGAYIATFGDTLENLEHYCRGAKLWMDDPCNGTEGAKLLGIHIEGTFLNDRCRGAQPAEHCLIPTRDDCLSAIGRLHATGAARVVNIVPDYGEESLKTIARARELGILTGAGHTNAPADLLRQAFDEYGLQFMVHFTNGPTGQSFKPFGGGGAFEGGMDIPIFKELILDRAHVDRRYVLDIMKRTEERWGLDKIVGITDATFPNPEEIPSGEFYIGTTIARRDETGGYLRAIQYRQEDGSLQSAPRNTLCGSVLSMNQAFANLVTLFTQDIQGHWFDHQAIPLNDAVVKAARICATHQTMLNGNHDKTGSVENGKSADLTIGNLERLNGEYTFHVRHVFIQGQQII